MFHGSPKWLRFVNFVEISFHGFYSMCSKTFVVYQFQICIYFLWIRWHLQKPQTFVTQENFLPYNVCVRACVRACVCVLSTTCFLKCHRANNIVVILGVILIY